MADFPDIEPDLEEIGLIANNQVYDSILTGEVQTASLSGAKWTCAPTFSNRNGKEARDLRAFIFGQNGVSGRFNYYPASIDNVGTHAGLGVVDGAGQTGNILETRGWDADQPLLFAAGDYITGNGEMKMVTADVAVGQDYIEYDDTNYMPSPLDPASWPIDVDGTVSNITLANPSGESVLGIAEQTGAGYFICTSGFAVPVAVSDNLYASILVKQLSVINFSVVLRINDSVNSKDTRFSSANGFTPAAHGNDEFKVENIGDGYYILSAKRTATGSGNGFSQVILMTDGGAAAPVGSQCYVQATFFGKANDWPAKLRANATIPITPPMRTSPSDGALIEANNPYFQGRLESDDMSRLQVSSPVIYNTTLSIVEAF